MISIRTLQPRHSQCPFCRSLLDASDRIVRCFQCHTDQHLSCWIENGNRCSVFSCSQPQKFLAVKTIAATQALRYMLLLHFASNVATHFFINSLAPLVFTLHTQDAVIVTGLEMIFIVSGIALLRRFRLEYGDSAMCSSPLIFFHLTILSANFIFLSMLAFYAISEGIQSVIALIRL